MSAVAADPVAADITEWIAAAPAAVSADLAETVPAVIQREGLSDVRPPQGANAPLGGSAARAAASLGAMSARAPQDDIPAQQWNGGPVECAGCSYLRLRGLEGRLGCEPGYACMQDVYARRIDRFFRWHPTLGDAELGHPYFEVRAIAARCATVFRLTALMDDPDETVRLQIALRLPMTQLLKMVNDPHREVRIRVAQRLAPIDLALMRNDADYGVRELVAQRLPLPLLPTMASDKDRAVRMRVAKRLDMPALLRMADDAEPEVRCTVAERLPVALLQRLASDTDWRVRFEVALRADSATLKTLLKDPEADIRQTVAERLQRLENPQSTDHVWGVIHG
jgi:hypothetical protein